MSDNEIPARAPGESPGEYLKRLKSFEDEIHYIDRIRADVAKTLIRRQKRIDSIQERIIIERAVRRSLRPVRTGGIDPRSNRWYKLPDNPIILLFFAPLYILISILFQDVTRTDNRYDKGIVISHGDPGGDNDR